MKKIILTSCLAICTIANAQELNKSSLDSLFIHLNKEKIGAGSVSIFQDGKEIYANSYGNRDFEKNTPNNHDTKFRIGSISKTFTATLILKMVEDGKLTLDTKLSKFYPKVINSDKTTIRHLLQHQSGIHNITDDSTYLNWFTKDQSKEDLLIKINNLSSDFEPNTKESYSNTNYILLTFIVEDVSKKSYNDLINKYIIKPLNLKNTKVGNKILVDKNEAKSYQYLSNQYVLQPETAMTVPMGAGFLVSTPTDLNTFMYALFNGKILKKETVEQMKKINEKYGLGLGTNKIDNQTGIGHSGAIDSFMSYAFCFDETKFCYSYIKNTDEDSPNLLMNNLYNATHNKKINFPTKIISLTIPENILKNYTNEYTSTEIPLGSTFFIENKTLMAQGTGQQAFPLDAISNTNFEFSPAKLQIEFSEDGKTMKLIQNGRTFQFSKK